MSNVVFNLNEAYMTDQNGVELNLVYENDLGETFLQPVADLTEVGTLVDPDSGEDMQIVGYMFTTTE